MPIADAFSAIPLAVVALLFIVGGDAALLRRRARAVDSITFLQWNMHGECFISCQSPEDRHCDKSYPACRGNATAFLSELMAGHNKHASSVPDFAGLEQLNDKDFLESGLDSDTWAHFAQLCGGFRGYGVWPFDIAVLFFNKNQWRVVGTGGVPQVALGGCMEKVDGAVVPNYRAFIVQAFERKSDGAKLIVVVSHNPHPELYEDEISALRQAVGKIQNETGIRKVVLVSDTNWNFPQLWAIGKSSQSVMNDIYPDAGEVASTELHTTCCAWQYTAAYDRIIAAGFPNAIDPIETHLPFGDVTPPWVALHMHNPITGKLACSGAGTFEWAG